jgi:hypothetical protein
MVLVTPDATERVTCKFFFFLSIALATTYSNLKYPVHSHGSSISSSHKIFKFKFKQFGNYLNWCNKIILVSYNLQYFYIFYDFKNSKI